MEDKQKNKIANELFFAGKCFLIGLITAFILSILTDSLKYFFRDFDQALVFSLVFIGIGYAIRLIKWVFKWKS